MQLASFLERNHHNLSRRHTKTIRRDAGEVKFVLRTPELELPEGHAPIIDFFLSRVGGKRYLIRTWKLNRTAIRHAPDSTFSLLKPFGAWRGRHRQILVKSPSEEKSVTISNKRHNER
jgi:phage host-nuclease inhibitor protein Gam